MHRSKKAVYIILYFVLNLFVTFTNKQILDASTDHLSRRPYLLTAMHASASCIGSMAFSHIGSRTEDFTSESKFRSIQMPSALSWRQHLHLAIFSLFYTINIALSNWSLALVSITLSQTIRAMAPVLTMGVSVFFLKRHSTTYSNSTCLSLIPTVLGVILATSSTPTTTTAINPGADANLKRVSGFQPDVFGIAITLLGTLTAVLKTIFTHRVTTSLSLNLSPIDLLRILSPYAAVQSLFFAFMNGELDMQPSRVVFSGLFGSSTNYTTRDQKESHRVTLSDYRETPSILHVGWAILWLANATAAFLLNVVSFEANKSCGPVGMAVAANMKQVAILIISLVNSGSGSKTLGHDEVTTGVVVGSVLTMFGGTWYAWSIPHDKADYAISQTPTEAASNRVDLVGSSESTKDCHA